MKIAFVLLHYNNDSVTKESIKYLDQLNREKQEVFYVIVDNCSPNGTGLELKKLYERREDITVILNEKNGGFTYGNNIGYQYAKQVILADIIVVMNTDVYIKDTDFIKKVVDCEKEVYVIAPDIITKDGGHQNPFRTKKITNYNLRRIYFYNLFINKIYYVPFINNLVASILETKQQKEKKQDKNEQKLYNIVPHGACLIFTNLWVQKENIAFVKGPFMYMEEEFLMDYLIKNNYKSLYDPKLVVYHIEDASADASNKNAMFKRRFISKNMTDSARLLLKLRKDGEY